MSNINRVVLTGNLTADPELRSLPSGSSVCELRLAVSTRQKIQGEWGDKSHYFNVVVFGGQAENAVKYLTKGRPVAIDGRLDFQQWEKDGEKRSTVKIVADTVQYLNSGQGNSNGAGPDLSGYAPASAPPPPATADDDIPF